MYDPILGRWLEQDPIGFDAGDMNLYRFVGNDPTNTVDPSGLQVQKRPPSYQPTRKQLVEDYLKKGKPTDVTIPKSGDGTDGFGFQLEGYKIKNIVIDRIDTSGLPVLIRPLVPNKDKIKKEIENQLKGKGSYGFNSLAPNTEIDEKNKQTFDKKRIRIKLKDQKIYPKPGSDWYIKITGEIEVDCDKAWIAPSKKK